MGRKMKTAQRFAFDPDYAVSPGATLLESIAALGMDQKELSQRTGFTEKHISQIIQGKASISPDAAIRFERVTGVPAHFWSALETKYREHLARLDSRRELEAGLDWLKSIPVKELVKRGAIPEIEEPVSILENVLQMFGVASVSAWNTGWSKPEFAFRKSSHHPQKDGALATWLRLGEIDAAQRECRPFEAKIFRANLERIRPLTSLDPAKFIPRMIDLCAQGGVALSLIPEIKGAPVSGAAKWLSSTKGLICLNLRGKFNDRFWFTFFHEAGHILNDSKREVFVDVDYRDDPKEVAANQFACHLLIPPRFERELPGLKSRAAVLEFAQRIGVHPGVVVGRLQRDGILPYSHLNALKVKFAWA